MCTLVGEPQNLLIGHEMGWHFADFFFEGGPGFAQCWSPAW